MTIDEQFRPPHEIIADLLSFVGINESAYDRMADEIEAVTEEAAAYLAKVEANRQAWARLEELHKTCIFDQANVRWDPGL